jgi:hypothetical protein
MFFNFLCPIVLAVEPTTGVEGYVFSEGDSERRVVSNPNDPMFNVGYVVGVEGVTIPVDRRNKSEQKGLETGLYRCSNSC